MPRSNRLGTLSISIDVQGNTRAARQRRSGLLSVAQWEKQHGRLTADEMNDARRKVRAQLRTSLMARHES